MKSERLKKLETELNDLQQWMKLGLVPKKELERHQDEISHLQNRIGEERERLQFLKESGELEEYTMPKRSPSKTVYPDTPSMSEVDSNESSTESSTTSFEMDTETMDTDATEGATRDEETSNDETERDEDDPFSDRNRWKRGGIIDPDATEW